MTASRLLWAVGLASAAIAVGAGVWWGRKLDASGATGRSALWFFQAFTGWNCVGCGLTRALYEVVHGDSAEALWMNPRGMLRRPWMPGMPVYYTPLDVKK